MNREIILNNFGKDYHLKSLLPHNKYPHGLLDSTVKEIHRLPNLDIVLDAVNRCLKSFLYEK